MAGRILLLTYRGYVRALSRVRVGLNAACQGIFAGEVGTPRLLKLFAKYNIKTTWFIPGAPLFLPFLGLGSYAYSMLQVIAWRHFPNRWQLLGMLGTKCMYLESSF